MFFVVTITIACAIGTSLAIWFMNVWLKRSLSERRTRRSDYKYEVDISDSNRGKELRQTLLN